MKTLKFPENSTQLVVVPSNEKGTGFLRTCYDPQYLTGIMSESDFLYYIDAASKVVAKVYSQKRIADTTGISKPKLILLSLSVILAFLFMILIYLAI